MSIARRAREKIIAVLVIVGLASVAIYAGFGVWTAAREGVISHHRVIHRSTDPALFNYTLFRLGAGAVVCAVMAVTVAVCLRDQPTIERRMDAFLRRQAELKAMDNVGVNTAVPFPATPRLAPSNLKISEADGLSAGHTGGGPTRMSRLPAWLAGPTTPSRSICSISEAARL